MNGRAKKCDLRDVATELNQSFIVLSMASEIANVETPTWRTTSASKIPRISSNFDDYLSADPLDRYFLFDIFPQ